jgi:hypothetical protein
MNWMLVTSEPLGATLACSVTVVPETAAVFVVTNGFDATVKDRMEPELLPLVLLAESR